MGNIRLVYVLICVLTICGCQVTWSKTVTDTLATRSGEQVIITYSVVQDGSNISVSIDENDIRFLPTEKLRKKCDGDLSRLKLIVFDQVGGYSVTTFTGEQPKALGTPSNISHTKSQDGYYILGESSPIPFIVKDNNCGSFGITAFIALYEKKHTYRLIGQIKKDIVVKFNDVFVDNKSHETPEVQKETITIQSTTEIESDNDNITYALECVNAVEEELETVTQFPFPRLLETRIEELYSLKRHVTDKSVRAKIEKILQACESKELELREEQDAATRQAQAEALALQEQRHQEELQRQAVAEEKTQLEAEKRQKRNLWMLIGGAILAVLCFIFNGIFRHFRDIRNQKSMFEMQQSLTRQAENEASRRARQIVRNKTHQVINQGRTKARTAVKNKINGKSNNNNRIRSI